MVDNLYPTCPHCENWAALYEKDWQHRQRQMAKFPQALAYACPVCKTTNWAYTRAKIKPPHPLLPPWQLDDDLQRAEAYPGASVAQVCLSAFLILAIVAGVLIIFALLTAPVVR